MCTRHAAEELATYGSIALFAKVANAYAVACVFEFEVRSGNERNHKETALVSDTKFS